MNDIYLLTFSLLSFYLFLKDKSFLSALSFGLAVSSKWSAVWLIPIIVISHLALKKKIRLSYLWFLVVPPVIYLASYLPMFLTGHNFDIFIGMQKQMWWYHTQLEADHAYTSLWWSWPFLARPIWLYTSGRDGGLVANIYAMGNPIIFWGGLISLAVSGVYSFFEKNKKLGLIIFSYLIFFAPWAMSPRIMFLYHYLPSIPFLAIAIGWVLRRYEKLIIPFFSAALLLFIYFYPHLAGIKVPIALDTSYYWFNSWR
jgi:dolichyl-phosphate-mannose--protein O-mannosyl transferase